MRRDEKRDPRKVALILGHLTSIKSLQLFSISFRSSASSIFLPLCLHVRSNLTLTTVYQRTHNPAGRSSSIWRPEAVLPKTSIIFSLLLSQELTLTSGNVGRLPPIQANCRCIRQ